MEELKISNRQIAMMAFDRLREENKKDSALRLARCLLQGTSISLGIGDIDWDIDTAIRQCGGELYILIEKCTTTPIEKCTT